MYRLFFEYLDVTRQDLEIPFKFAPRYHREIWQLFQNDIVGNALVAALSDKFQAASISP